LRSVRTPISAFPSGAITAKNPGAITPQSDTLAGEDQTPTAFYAYSPFGETAARGESADTDGNASQYTGRENDGTGLYYYRARYYDPVLKRFISEDPIGLAGGLNSYGYVDNNPLDWLDSDGLKRGRDGNGRGRKGRSGRGPIPPPPPSCPPQDDGNNECDQQLEEEEASCYDNYGLFGPRGSNYALNGCLTRAFERYVACLQGRQGPPPWSDADVDSWQPPKAPKRGR
jgi:RHS repeat-associated protein